MSNFDEPERFQHQSWKPEPPPNDDEQTNTGVWVPEDAALPSDHSLLWLIVRLPLNQRGKVLAILPGDMLGRGKNANVIWEDDRMSRRHARFTLEAEPDSADKSALYYFVWPQEARHGIYVNGELIRGAKRLSENDEIRMGDTTFVVKILD